MKVWCRKEMIPNMCCNAWGMLIFFNTDMENASKWYSVLFSKYENVLEPKYAFPVCFMP